jgi:hypothetical protein
MEFVYWGAFTSGLALCNQHTIILYAIPLVFWILFLIRRRLYYQPILLLYIALAFLVGISPYAYLPISAHYKEVAGSWGDVKSLQGFLHHVLGKDYGTFQLFSGAAGRQVEGFWQRNDAYLTDVTFAQCVWQLNPFLALVGAISWVLFGLSDFLPTPPSIKPSVPKTAKRKVTPKTKLAEVKIESAPSQSVALDLSTSQGAYVDEKECRFTPLVFLLTQVFYFAVVWLALHLFLGRVLEATGSRSRSSIPNHSEVLRQRHQRPRRERWS